MKNDGKPDGIDHAIKVVAAADGAVEMGQLMKPNGAAPNNNTELISVMNANALAQDNQNLREQVAELKAQMVAAHNAISSMQKQVRDIGITVAQTHGKTDDTQTRLKAHMRDEHGLAWQG